MALVKEGVVPTLIPIKPLDGTPMEKYHTTNSSEYLELSRDTSSKMAEEKLVVKEASGCASCGACSLENDLRKE
jgi:hypothetical protein